MFLFVEVRSKVCKSLSELEKAETSNIYSWFVISWINCTSNELNSRSNLVTTLRLPNHRVKYFICNVM